MSNIYKIPFGIGILDFSFGPYHQPRQCHCVAFYVRHVSFKFYLLYGTT